MIIWTHFVGCHAFLEVWSYLLEAEKRNSSTKFGKVDLYVNSMFFLRQWTSFNSRKPLVIIDFILVSNVCSVLNVSDLSKFRSVGRNLELKFLQLLVPGLGYEIGIVPNKGSILLFQPHAAPLLKRIVFQDRNISFNVYFKNIALYVFHQ